mgnify:CR=1 FL=1
MAEYPLWRHKPATKLYWIWKFSVSITSYFLSSLNFLSRIGSPNNFWPSANCMMDLDPYQQSSTHCTRPLHPLFFIDSFRCCFSGGQRQGSPATPYLWPVLEAQTIFRFLDFSNWAKHSTTTFFYFYVLVSLSYKISLMSHMESTTFWVQKSFGRQE